MLYTVSPPDFSFNFTKKRVLSRQISFQGKGKKEKKKNKMLKLDSRILGFSVTAAQDRLNVGDRDYSYGDAP